MLNFSENDSDFSCFSSAVKITFYEFFPVSDYGLYQTDEDPRKGRWLDPNRQLEFYLLRNGVSPVIVRVIDCFFD